MSYRRKSAGPDGLLTVADVCDRLSVKPAWVYAQVAADRLPVVRVGKFLRFRQSMIDDIVANGLDSRDRHR